MNHVKNSQNTPAFFNAVAKNSESPLAMKDAQGDYVLYQMTKFSPFETIDEEVIDDLEDNGRDFFEAGRYDEALQCFINVLAVRKVNDFSRWELFKNISMILIKLQRLDEALEAIYEAELCLKTQTHSIAYAMQSVLEQKQILQAVELENLVPAQITPISHNFFNSNKAAAQLSLKNQQGTYSFSVAIDFPSSTKITPKLIEELLDNGQHYYQARRYAEAITCYENVLSKQLITDPHYWQTCERLASAYVSVGQDEKALLNLEKAQISLKETKADIHFDWLIRGQLQRIRQPRQGNQSSPQLQSPSLKNY